MEINQIISFSIQLTICMYTYCSRWHVLTALMISLNNSTCLSFSLQIWLQCYDAASFFPQYKDLFLNVVYIPALMHQFEMKGFWEMLTSHVSAVIMCLFHFFYPFVLKQLHSHELEWCWMPVGKSNRSSVEAKSAILLKWKLYWTFLTYSTTSK